MAVLEMSEAVRRLRDEYRDQRLIPFIGAGFSKPLKLPDWGELIGKLAEPLGFDAELFLKLGRFEQLAEFYARAAPGNFGKLVYETTRSFDAAEVEERRKTSRMHRALAARSWRTLYTTNYDRHLEGALKDAGKPYKELASFDDFQGPRTPDACEVVKFHGTLTKPETLVLTESSYFQRMSLETPVDQRLRSDLLSHSFLFIGYSFNDTNTRYIWFRMHQLRMQSQAAMGMSKPHLGRRCFFTSFGAGPIQPDLLDQWNIDVILLDPMDKEGSVTALLEGLR